MAAANAVEVGEVIQTIGFWRAKGPTLRHGGPGHAPGRRSAANVLNKMLDVVDGIAVDTHVYRISKRMPKSTRERTSRTSPPRALEGRQRVDSLWARSLHRSQPHASAVP